MLHLLQLAILGCMTNLQERHCSTSDENAIGNSYLIR